MKENERKYGALLLPIILVLIAFMAFNVFCVSGYFASASDGAVKVVAQNRFGKVGYVEGLDELRKKYFNSAVSENVFKPASFDGDRWVIVELDGDALYDEFKSSAYADFSAYCKTDEADKVRNTLVLGQNEFLSLLDENGIDYEFKYSYTTLTNGVAVKVNSGAYNLISGMTGVKRVYFSESYATPSVATVNNANVYTTGIYDSSDLSYQGEGMVVAVLDTGLDYAHEAFAHMPTNPAWSKEDVASKMASSLRFNAKATADEVYYNAKVPYAYDYADDDPDVYPSYSTHGTHVAGIVGGKSDYVVNEVTGEKFIGVAPEAQLVICKVFTDNLDSHSLGGADTTDIIAAVSDCVELGVDVINMSLGSSAGFADEKSNSAVNEVYSRVKEAGISLVVAASNDYSSGFGGGNGTNLASNPDSATVGSPSTYEAALSVASINGQKATYIQANNDENQVAFITASSDENGNEYKFTELLYEKAGKDPSQTLNYKYVVIGGVGRATSYNAAIKREINNKSGYDGVIALIKRGDTTFAEKVQTAMNNGVDACIIYNNVSGTIRMSLGDVENPVPTCSISMDAGKVFVENAVRSVGSIQIDSSFMAGPFMSDFSSWGPLPDLQLKPEITAHGGEITSAVPGGYDIYSGTSMAAPNMAGAIALLRQYLKDTTSLSGTDLNARINQVLMSTATIALNEEGNPYSPRKQGAGLAGIADAINTESYLSVFDSENNERDKTKIELFDDKKKKGVYELDFVINNVSGKAESYEPVTYVMTETLASDNKTVAEKAHMLSDSRIVYYVNGVEHSGKIAVPANAKVSVRVVITLGSVGRKYLDDSFENGMYVEGFVSLKAVDETKVTIGLPYLAFYGDWNDAPLFDYDTYELAASKMDTGVPEEDKLKASAADTRPLGMYYDDKYIIELGAYLYAMDESEVAIYPTKEKAAVSIYDSEGRRTIYEMYMVYAGLLRNAAYMSVEVSDAVTGEILYAEFKENISKSYAAGGSNRGAPIMLEIKPDEWGLVNNSTYIVKLKGQLDYPGGENPDRNTFDFQFTVDYEAPQMLDYRIRFEPYKDENKQVKYKIFMDVDVYDNQYVMDVMPCYVKTVKNKNVLTLLTQYPVPVYGAKGEVSTVSFEITDVYDDYVKTGKLYIAVDDYAMNQSTFVISPTEAIEYPDSVRLVTDEKLVDTGNTGRNGTDGIEYGIYELTISPNEVYRPIISVLPTEIASRGLIYSIQSGSRFIKVNEEEIFAMNTEGGVATVYLCDNETSQKVIYAQIEVVVQGEAKQLPRLNKISLLPTENGKDYVVSLEGTLPKLEMNPNGKASLRVKADPWYMSDLDLEWSSMDDTIASVDAIGTVFAHRKGTTIISVSVVGNATVGKSITVSVGDDYRIINYTLYDYYGGAECVIPDSKNVMMLDEECFQYNKTLKKVVFPTTLTEIPEKAFLGCENLEEIVVPSQCIVIHKSAFEGCGKLKKITFGKFVDKDKVEHPEYTGAITIGENAFKDCKSLSVIENSKRITTVGDGAFENCIALTEIDLTELRVTGKRAFAGCTALTTVATDSNTGVGEEMFFGCSSVTNFDFYGNYVSQGAFYGCSSLNSFRFFSDSFAGIGKSAFAGASSLTGITLPDGEYTIEAGAFANCTGLKYVELSDGTVIRSEGGTPFNGCSLFGAYRVNASNANYSVEDGVLYNKDKTVLVAVPVAKTSVSVPGDVTEIAAGAMSGVTALTSFDASGITAIGSYAFAGSGVVSVALSDGIVSLPEGIFSGCMKLTEVSGLGSVKTVEPYAFRNCAKLTSLSLPKAEYVGDGAFEKSGVTSVELPKVRTIGASAFEGSSIVEINLPESEIIGSRAFYNTKLRRASLGGITEMGEYVFVKSNDITDVVFSTGTKVVGDYAFFSTTERVALTTVVLPDGVEYIGKCAFVLCSALTEINVAETKEIGVMAFYGCKALENVDLHNAERIGDNAFAKTALVSADLSNAVVIGEYAFSEAPLETVVFDKLKILGIGAFVETRLTSVTLPASFGDRYYDYSWEVLDEKNRVEQVRHRNELAYGAGAFSYIDTLTEILVADGNNDFVSVDGVLYSRVGKGYVLEQYPTAKEGESYTVIDKTVAIGASAFEGVDGLEAITFPYTVKAIGSFAFYDSTVAKYTFNSVQAPVLYAEAINGDAYSGAEQGSDEYYIYLFFGSNGVGGTHYYANFYDFVAKKIYLLEEYRPEFKLTLTVPKNGKGYDSNIWEGFFETVVVTDEILPDDVTHEAIEAINGIDMTPDEIAAAADMAALTEISAKVKAARIAFNKITGSDQLSLAEVKAAKEVLLGAEKALRDRKEALGYPVAVEKLVLSAIPDKIKYVEGEEFDATGMIITVIFEDLSEMAVTDYTVNKSVLSLDDESVIVSYVKNGVTYTVEVKVNVVAKEGGDVVIDDGGKKGLSKTEIIIICVVCGTAACAGIAVAVVLIVLKKKGRFGKKTANDKNAEDDTAAADGEEKENGENVGCSETEEKE